ncbi:oleate hydratase [Nonomuraea sp. NPDC046570]|uniref:oleate hydratase n=1 Tax=Nonomuraea sp. NPDC046570 TaxID=3155255 RepID=UPI0033DA5AF1
MTNVGTAYLVGGGIASLAAAVFLVRDAGVDGGSVRVLEELPVAGGALDGSGDPVKGYVTRGGRMLEEEAYVCLWDLLDSVPTLTDPDTTVKQEIWDFNRTWRTKAGARLVNARHEILDAADLGLSARDRAELFRVLALPERVIGSRRIDEFFSEHFFTTNFWAMWRTTFAFQTWSSAIELKRYLLRFTQEFPRIHTLAGVRRTVLNQYDSIVRPVQKWLTDRGVVFEYGTTVTDIDFEQEGGARRVTRLVTQHGPRDLGPGDLAFITLGSMTSDSTYGDDDHAAELIRDGRDGGFRLWRNIAGKAPDFGRPDVFSGNVDQTKWVSFTLTMRSPLLLRRIEDFSGNAPGTGALMTFVDSGWLMSIVVPYQPHFAGQPDDVFTLWGYGLFPDRPGDHVPVTMAQATGQEMLTELVRQLGFEDDLEEIRRTTKVIPVMMPYITSQFQPRGVDDRPLVVPKGAANFAFLGQFTEIPEDVVFTVEYSVRGAMHAVYGLLGVDRKIPGIYHALADPKVAFEALKTALT